MKQKNDNRKANMIITADWHLRESAPRCRMDDFEAAQWEKVRFISELQKEHKCPVIHAGDLFHHWKPSPSLLTKCIENLPDQFMTVYGNHDLPQHSMELAEKTGVYTLFKAGVLTILPGGHWEQNPQVSFSGKREVIISHIMTWAGKSPWPGCTDKPAHQLLEEADCDLYITGHNHKSFIHKSAKKILVNPGSLTRQGSDQVEHVPTVYLWFMDTNELEPVTIPHKQAVINTSNILEIKQRDERISAFVETLNKEWEGGANFEQVLEHYINQNELDENVVKIIKSIVYE